MHKYIIYVCTGWRHKFFFYVEIDRKYKFLYIWLTLNFNDDKKKYFEPSIANEKNMQSFGFFFCAIKLKLKLKKKNIVYVADKQN